MEGNINEEPIKKLIDKHLTSYIYILLSKSSPNHINENILNKKNLTISSKKNFDEGDYVVRFFEKTLFFSIHSLDIRIDHLLGIVSNYFLDKVMISLNFLTMKMKIEGKGVKLKNIIFEKECPSDEFLHCNDLICEVEIGKTSLSFQNGNGYFKDVVDLVDCCSEYYRFD